MNIKFKVRTLKFTIYVDYYSVFYMLSNASRLALNVTHLSLAKWIKFNVLIVENCFREEALNKK